MEPANIYKQLNPNINMRDWIKVLIIAIAIVISISISSYVLPFGTPQHTVLSIIFIGMILWFSELIPLHVTALIVAFLLIVLGGFTPKDIFAPFFDPVIVLLLGGFVIALGMQKHKLDEYIALKLLGKTSNSPKIFLLVLMYLTAFLSMWISNTASTAILIPIGIVILSKNGLKPLKSSFGKSMILGIAFSATIGGIGTLVGSTPNVIAAKFLTENGIQFGFIEWMFHGLPFVLLFIPVAWFVLISIFKPDIKTLKTVKFDKSLSGKQKQVIVVFLITVVLWLTTSIHGIASSTISLIPIFLLYGARLLDTKDFSRIDWATLILIGGGLTLGLSMHAVGLDIMFANVMQTIIIGQPLFLALVIVASFAVILTLFASNTAAAAVMIPIMIPLAITLGLDVRSIVVIAAIGTSLDFIVPIGTPPSAIAYGSGYIRMKDMAKVGVVIAVLGILLISGMAILYW